jgi:hypothetical protein
MQPRQGRACFPLTFVIWGNFSESQDLDALLANVLTRSLGPGLAYDLLTSLPLPPLCCTTVPPCYCILHLLAVFPFALLSIEPCVAPWACRKPDTARVFPLGGTFFWLFAYPSHLCWPRAEGRKIRTQLYPLRVFSSKSCTTVLGHQVYINTLSLLIPTARHVVPVAKAFGRSAATTCWRRHRIPGLPGQQQPCNWPRSSTCTSAWPHWIHVLGHPLFITQLACQIVHPPRWT